MSYGLYFCAQIFYPALNDSSSPYIAEKGYPGNSQGGSSVPQLFPGVPKHRYNGVLAQQKRETLCPPYKIKVR